MHYPKAVLILLWLIPWNGFAFVFQYQNTNASRTYRIFSASLQNVQQNLGIPRASFEQAYEAFLRVKDINVPENKISLMGEYHYSQRIFHSKEAFQALNRNKVYNSYFSRDGQGVLKSFSDKYFYPSIRSVPVFPKEDVPLGGQWKGFGNEFQDFSLLGYSHPFRVPFAAEYHYIRDVALNKKDFQDLQDEYSQYRFRVQDEMKKDFPTKDIQSIAMIHVRYVVDYSSQDDTEQTERMQEANGNPVISAKGFYRGLIFWNKQTQEEILNIGEYDFQYLWKNMEKRRWTGKEYGIVNVLESSEEKIADLAKKVKNIDQKLEVQKGEQGVKVILGDLLFHFNKTSLRPEVVLTLSKMVQVLKENPGSAIHITGYSDNIGTKEAKEKIADGRARNVANFLLNHGVAASRISYSGNGDRNPRVPNTSAANRRKNRRVEIDIITQ